MLKYFWYLHRLVLVLFAVLCLRPQQFPLFEKGELVPGWVLLAPQPAHSVAVPTPGALRFGCVAQCWACLGQEISVSGSWWYGDQLPKNSLGKSTKRPSHSHLSAE